MANQLNENNVAEFIGQLVDILEDYLSEVKGVTPAMLPNEDRDREFGDNDEGAIIYGEDYDIIDEAIRAEIDMVELVETDNVIDNNYTKSIIIGHIYEGYLEVTEKVGGLTMNEHDERTLKHRINETFENWGIFE